jgi:hypothetical protein
MATRNQAQRFVRELEQAIEDSPKHNRCDQCEALVINGVYCHETGCPNAHKTWDADRQAWIQYVDCFVCGYPVEVGTVCDCQADESFERGPLPARIVGRPIRTRKR